MSSSSELTLQHQLWHPESRTKNSVAFNKRTSDCSEKRSSKVQQLLMPVLPDSPIHSVFHNTPLLSNVCRQRDEEQQAVYDSR
ncbi:hypothetical protein Fmac_028199 [Flemingia macrophylla]|uniref:Uncharacterized protein n=1 Tax=Flemingia macrophylla TaxID=520843 RepID=A0ABD1L6U1_9FABA